MGESVSKPMKKIYHAVLWGYYFPHIYKKAASKPVQKGKIVFVEQQAKELSNNLQLIYDMLEKSERYQLSTHCLLEGTCSKKEYLDHAKTCLEDVATAEAVFLCDGSRLISCATIRPETKVAQVWHACGAFKKFGFSTADHLFGGNEEEYLKYPYYKNCDIVTVSSEEVVRSYEVAMGFEAGSGIVEPLGISRSDVFFKPDFCEQAVTRVKEIIPQANDRKVILYAPTFRGNVSEATTPDKLELQLMKEKLGNEYIVLIKHHQFVKVRPTIEKSVADFAFDVSDTCAIEDLLCISDICISDYSSLVFEYSLMERPMFFFAYDLADYNDWRGFFYDYDDLTPGPVVKTTKKLIEKIENIDTYDMTEIKAFKNKFMNACDGNATKRLLEYLELS